MRKILLLTTFFALTPVFLLFSIIYLSFLIFTAKHEGNILSFHASRSNVAYAALPTTDNNFQAYTEASDARVEKVRQFFHRYHSPLEDYAQNIVIAADANGMDYKLLPAIAMEESTGCQKAISDTNNCWGFGIYGKHVKRFDSYAEAIDTVSKTLAKEYVAQGLQTPEQIEKKYTPSSQGNWANGVNYFINQLE